MVVASSPVAGFTILGRLATSNLASRGRNGFALLGLTRSRSEAIHLFASTSVETGPLPRFGYRHLRGRRYMVNDQLP